MMTWGLQTGPERAELQELNARLCDYVRRVRELERENLLLEEELRARRAHESLEAEGQARFADEARRLREQLAELGWAVALAEGERDALRRELTGLRLLGEEARAARGRLDAELSAQRRELQEALGARAALEALLGRLLAERDGLDATHERDVRALRLRARHAGPPLLYRARAPGLAAPPPGLRELHASCARLVAESWGETARRCEDEVRALEEALRRGGESRRQAEEEARLCAREAEALRREAQELERLRARLEDELARMREASELQAEERQRIIACLEDEKADLTLAMADRLRDYQELMQVKTGLSLEVATYRALLEGESNPEILLVTEHIENIPHDFRDTFKYSSSAVQRENERNLFLRQKAPLPVARLDLGLRPALSASPRSRAGMDSETRRGFLSSGYSSLTTSRQESTCGKTTSGQTTFRTLSPTRGSSWNTEAQVQTFPPRPQDTPASVTREPTVLTGISESTRSSERTTAVLGKKAETKGTREPERSRVEIVQTKREEKMFDSKEKASEERNLRWEELTKLDRDTRKRESQQRQDKAKGKELLAEKGQREREIPIKVVAVQDSSPEVSPKDLQTPLNELAGGGTTGGMEVKETRFRLVTSDTMGTTESIAENLVSDILKQFTQSPQAEGSSHPFPDTKVTYMGKKELPGEGKARTEIVMESKLTEEIDVSDTAGLEHLLSKDAKEVELKGKSAERMISDIIHLGLKGREGQAKVVNVEIVEEPVSYVRGEQTHDVSIPFHVEEVEDMSPGPGGLEEEEEEEEEEEGEEGAQKHPLFPGEQYQKGKKPRESVTQVEEVTDVGDWEGEQSYFVSTPDDHPGDQDGDHGSVYGQIHIEEKATIRYSWQDEITTPGIQRRAGRDEAAGEKVVELQGVGEPSTEGKEGSAGWRGQVKQGEFHTAPIIIEKEIKIPHEFHTAIRGGPKEPRQQLVEVMGQLEESLPERVKTELSALAREAPGSPGSVSVDVQKVQAAGSGAMTLVAEVNLSQTVDADQLDLEELSRDEARDIERAVESVVQDSLARQHSPVPGSPEQEREAPAAGLLFRRWATQELYTSTGEEEEDVGSGQVTPHSPVSATVEVTSPRGYKAQSHVLEDISQSVRLVQIGPTGTWSTEQASPAAVVEMDVSHLEATPGWTRETTVLLPAGVEVEAPGQSSVISDEKKVAFLYLDNQEEEQEENDGQWF